MSDLSHHTVLTGDLRISPRSEVDERILEMLKPVVRAGFGIVPDCRPITLIARPRRASGRLDNVFISWAGCNGS
jgi:hypothetical protein